MQVRVNGQVVTEPGTQVDLRKDKVRLQEAAEANHMTPASCLWLPCC